MIEWPRVPLEQALEIPLRNGINVPSKLRGSGVKLINMGELFAHDRIGAISMELAPIPDRDSDKYLVREGDLLFARQSLTLEGAGKCSILLHDVAPRTWEGHLIRARVDSNRFDSSFLFYWFKSRLGRASMETIVEQVAAAGIRGSDLAKLPVPQPPLAEQRAIAEVLGALDDKIESNRRIVSLCEVLAHAFSIGLRNLPRAPLSEVASVSRVTENPTQFGNSPVDHFSIPAFDAGGSPEKIAASQIKSGKLRVKQRSVLVSRLNPGTPRVWVMAPDESPALCSTEFLVLSPLDNDSIGGVWLAVLGDEFTESMERRAAGTSFSHQRIKQGDALTVQVRDIRLADRQLLAQADALLMEVIQQRAEIAMLAQLRDTLLPALLSGRIRVPAAAELVEAP